ncbi:MAG: carboxypeptidase regulatory-like domain-containing protein [Candidatus Eremiobacterota bacterium]
MRYFICIFILFLTCVAVFAEDFDRGTISGLVQDKNLSAIEGVQVTIIGTENVCFTDSTGFFYFGDLEPGNYSLSFFMEGYEKVEKKLTVPKGQARALTVQLKPPGSSSEPNNPVTLNPLLYGSYTLYVANSGRPYVNNYDPDAQWDISLYDINSLIALRYKDESEEAYSKANEFFNKFYPNLTGKDVEAFIKFCKQTGNTGKSNLMAINSATREPVSIIDSPWPGDSSCGPLWVELSDKGNLYVADKGGNISVVGTGANNSLMTTLHMGDYMINNMALGNGGRKLFCILAGPVTSAVGIINTNTNAFVKDIPLHGNGIPCGIASHKTSHSVYVATGNDLEGEVVFINGETDSITGSVKVGQRPFGLDVTSDGKKLYVANQNSATVSVINTITREVIATVNTGYSPTGVAATPDGTKVFVTNKKDNTVSVINTVTDSLMANIPVGKEPVGVSVSRDGKIACVANSASDDVSIIDAEKNILIYNTFPLIGSMPFDVVIK